MLSKFFANVSKTIVTFFKSSKKFYLQILWLCLRNIFIYDFLQSSSKLHDNHVYWNEFFIYTLIFMKLFKRRFINLRKHILILYLIIHKATIFIAFLKLFSCFLKIMYFIPVCCTFCKKAVCYNILLKAVLAKKLCIH